MYFYFIVFFQIGQLSLAHLELRVFLANYIQATFALDNLAVLTTLFDGCLDFHICKFLFVSERYSALG